MITMTSGNPDYDLLAPITADAEVLGRVNQLIGTATGLISRSSPMADADALLPATQIRLTHWGYKAAAARRISRPPYAGMRDNSWQQRLIASLP